METRRLLGLTGRHWGGAAEELDKIQKEEAKETAEFVRKQRAELQRRRQLEREREVEDGRRALAEAELLDKRNRLFAAKHANNPSMAKNDESIVLPELERKRIRAGLPAKGTATTYNDPSDPLKTVTRINYNDKSTLNPQPKVEDPTSPARAMKFAQTTGSGWGGYPSSNPFAFGAVRPTTTDPPTRWSELESESRTLPRAPSGRLDPIEDNVPDPFETEFDTREEIQEKKKDSNRYSKLRAAISEPEEKRPVPPPHPPTPDQVRPTSRTKMNIDPQVASLTSQVSSLWTHIEAQSKWTQEQLRTNVSTSGQQTRELREDLRRALEEINNLRREKDRDAKKIRGLEKEIDDQKKIETELENWQNLVAGSIGQLRMSLLTVAQKSNNDGENVRQQIEERTHGIAERLTKGELSQQNWATEVEKLSSTLSGVKNAVEPQLASVLERILDVENAVDNIESIIDGQKDVLNEEKIERIQGNDKILEELTESTEELARSIQTAHSNSMTVVNSLEEILSQEIENRNLATDKMSHEINAIQQFSLDRAKHMEQRIRELENFVHSATARTLQQTKRILDEENVRRRAEEQVLEKKTVKDITAIGNRCAMLTEALKASQTANKAAENALVERVEAKLEVSKTRIDSLEAAVRSIADTTQSVRALSEKQGVVDDLVKRSYEESKSMIDRLSHVESSHKSLSESINKLQASQQEGGGAGLKESLGSLSATLENRIFELRAAFEHGMAALQYAPASPYAHGTRRSPHTVQQASPRGFAPSPAADDAARGLLSPTDEIQEGQHSPRGPPLSPRTAHKKRASVSAAVSDDNAEAAAAAAEQAQPTGRPRKGATPRARAVTPKGKTKTPRTGLAGGRRTPRTAAKRGSGMAKGTVSGKKMAYAKALHDYDADGDHELSLRTGDLVEVLEQDSGGWWFGRLRGQTGHFPYTFVKLVGDDDTEKIDVKDEEAKKRKEEEAKRKEEEELEAKKKAEEEAEAKKKAEVELEAKRKAEEEEEAKRKAEEEEAKKKAEEELETKRKAEEEEAKRKAEEELEAKKKAEEEEAKRKEEEEEKRKAEEEEELEAKRKAEEELEAKRKAEEEEKSPLSPRSSTKTPRTPRDAVKKTPREEEKAPLSARSSPSTPRDAVKKTPRGTTTPRSTAGSKPNTPREAAKKTPREEEKKVEEEKAPLSARSSRSTPRDAVKKTPREEEKKAEDKPEVWARAAFDYEADGPGEMSIRKGNEILVLDQNKSGWWLGRFQGSEGRFPSTYVKVFQKAKPRPGTWARAAFDYNADGPGEMTIYKGEEIQILEKDPSGWWLGTVRGEKGRFPNTFVKIVSESKEEVKEKPPLGKTPREEEKVKTPRSKPNTPRDAVKKTPREEEKAPLSARSSPSTPRDAVKKTPRGTTTPRSTAGSKPNTPREATKKEEKAEEEEKSPLSPRSSTKTPRTPRDAVKKTPRGATTPRSTAGSKPNTPRGTAPLSARSSTKTPRTPRERAKKAEEEAKRKAEEEEEAKRKAEEEEKKEKAAVKIQSIHRGRRDRERVSTIKQERQQEREGKAAVKIQSIHRGRRDRKRASAMKEENKAAVKIQSIHRGRRDRKHVSTIKQERENQEKAAVKIQSIHRGRRDRKRVSDIKAETLKKEEEKKKKKESMKNKVEALRKKAQEAKEEEARQEEEARKKEFEEAQARQEAAKAEGQAKIDALKKELEDIG